MAQFPCETNELSIVQILWLRNLKQISETILNTKTEMLFCIQKVNLQKELVFTRESKTDNKIFYLFMLKIKNLEKHHRKKQQIIRANQKFDAF